MAVIQSGNRNVATIEYSSKGQLSAVRGFDAVSLELPVHINISAEPGGPTWYLDDLSAELYGLEGFGNERLLATGRFPYVLQARPQNFDHDATVDLRCTPAAIAEFEAFRDHRPSSFRLKLKGYSYHLEAGKGSRRVLCEAELCHGQSDFQIDREKWTRVLRSVGLSASIVVEIPLESGEGDPDLKALSDAFDAFASGGSIAWKSCIDHIRPALLKWRDSNPKAATEPKDGSATDRDWKLLNLRDALTKCCHFWVHESAHAATRDDALLALSAFAALVKAKRTTLKTPTK